jgi:hypothetical protein
LDIEKTDRFATASFVVVEKAGECAMAGLKGNVTW